jgi:hypothetical protein
LAPGGTDGLGTLTCGNTTLASGTTLHVHVAGDAAGQYSVLNLGSGTLALGGATLTVDATGYTGTGPVVIARAGAITGTFGTVTGTKKTWTATTVNNTIVLNATNAGTFIRFF